MNKTFEQFKKETVNGDLIQKTVSLSRLEIDTDGTLSIGGKQMAVASTGEVEKNLFKILGLSKRETDKVGKATDENFKKEFINMMKGALITSNAKKTDVNVIANPRTKEIVNLLPANRDLIPTSLAFSMFENVMGDLKDIKITNMNHTNNGFVINVIKNTEVELSANGTRILGEAFNPGFSFMCDQISGITVPSFVNRLVCTNGMIRRDILSTINLKSLNEEEQRRFFEDFANMKKGDFIPLEMGEAIQQAIETRASFAELRHAKNIIMSHSDVKTESDLFSFLPEFDSEVKRLARAGYDYAKCTDRQLQNVVTKSSMWDVINRVTDFGSHNYGFNHHETNIQAAAGALLNKKRFDTQDILILN